MKIIKCMLLFLLIGCVTFVSWSSLDSRLIDKKLKRATLVMDYHMANEKIEDSGVVDNAFCQKI
ncbi:MAG: hypothetical protein ACM3TR_07865 [Caulobacteraceae bacterium]